MNQGVYAAEATNPDDGTLLALEVHPLKRYDGLARFIGQAQAWQREVLLALFDPDPF